MCRPPEPCTTKPPSTYARRYECPKLVLTSVYGGGYQYQPYVSPSACGGSRVGAENEPYGNLNGEVHDERERRHSGGYHDEGCRPQQQRQREFLASSPNLYGSISSTELLDVLARRGSYNWGEERSISFSSSYQPSPPAFTPMDVAGPTTPSGISSRNDRDLAVVEGALYASNSSVAEVILGSVGGGATAAANCQLSDVLMGTESGQSCDVQTSDSAALTVATDKSRKRARRNCMLSSSSQLLTASSRPTFVARTSESSFEDEAAHNGAKKGCHALACFTEDGRAKYLSNSMQHDVFSAGGCFGHCADNSVQRQQFRPSETAGMPTTLTINQPQPATLPLVSSLVPSLGVASAVSAVTVTMGALNRNLLANNAEGERVVGSGAEGVSSLGSDCAANVRKGVAGLSVDATTTTAFSPSVAVVVGNCVSLSESERGWMPASTATQRDLDNWIEEFLTSDPLPESMMDTLDCEFQPTDITDVCEAGVMVQTATTSDTAGPPVSIATAGNSVSVENVDQIEPVSAALVGGGAGVGDMSNDENDNGICSLRRKWREEDSHNSDVPLESLTDEEKKGDSASLLTRSVSQHIVLPDKKTKRMLSNRESARRSRQRRQELMDTLELEAARLRVENASLVRHARETAKTLEQCKLKNNSLNEELKTLRRKLCFYESPSAAGKGAGGSATDSVQARVRGGVMSVLFPAGERMCFTDDGVTSQDAEEKCGEEAKQGRCANKSPIDPPSGYTAAERNGDCRTIGREVNCASLSGGSSLTSSQLSPTNSSDDEGEGGIATRYSPWYGCDQFSDMVNMSKNDDGNVLDIGQDMATKGPIWSRSEGGGLPVVKAH